LDATELCVTASKGGFFSYIAGTAAVMTEHLSKPSTDAQKNYEKEKYKKQALKMSKNGNSHSTENESECNGIHIVNYKNDLPMGKGLSSSAAVCVLVAKCFNEVCDGDRDRADDDGDDDGDGSDGNIVPNECYHDI
jgi:mevalonate kinase